MASLPRQDSLDSNLSRKTSERVLVNGDSTEAGDPPTTNERSTSTGSKASSHSLMQDSANNSTSSRKSRFADAGTVGGTVGRASLSMPPPASKPSSRYRPSATRQPHSLTNAYNTTDVASGTQKHETTNSSEPHASQEPAKRIDSLGSRSDVSTEPHSPSKQLDGTLKPPLSSSNKPGDRRSFSSLYSLGSAVYERGAGAPSGPHSAASSSAGSIRGSILEQPNPLSLSPPASSSKPEITSPATTATDPISVTAHANTSHQGLIGPKPSSIGGDR